MELARGSVHEAPAEKEHYAGPEVGRFPSVWIEDRHLQFALRSRSTDQFFASDAPPYCNHIEETPETDRPDTLH